MRYGRGLVIALAAAAVAGCAVTIPGTPRPGLTPVDTKALKIGAYLPQPTVYDPNPSSAADLRLIEARRMLGYVVPPADIDPDLTKVGDVKFFGAPETPFTLGLFPEQFRPALVDNAVLNGTYVFRHNGSARNRKQLVVSILRFPTDAAATKATGDLFRSVDDNPGARPLAIDAHPDVRGYTRDDSTGSTILNRGPFVVLVNAVLPQPDVAGLNRVLGATLDRQLPLLDQLKPTPWDDVLDVPPDTDGIMRRALPKAPDYSDPFTDSDFAVYSPAAELHFERNPVQLKRAFDEAGVDLVGRRGGIVYRARDLNGAFRLQTALMAADRYDEVVDPPPGLPDVRCLRLDGDSFARGTDSFCAVVYGRYVAVVLAKTPLAARVDVNLYQRAAAQYAILANSE